MTGFNLVLALIVYAVLSTIPLYKKSLLIKLVTITYVFVIASLVYFSFETYKGWPTADRAEKEQQLLAVHIVDPRGKNPGAIYYWVSGAEEPTHLERLYVYFPSEVDSPPRAHHTPYSKKKADKFREAQQALEDGMLVTIESMENPGNVGEAKEPVSGESADGNKSANSGDADEYDVPSFRIESPSEKLEKNP